VTAAEVLEEAITRAEKLNGALNAITIPLYDLARKVAKGPLPSGHCRARRTCSRISAP